MVLELLDAAGSAVVQSISAPKKNYIATKRLAQNSGEERQEFLSVL